MHGRMHVTHARAHTRAHTHTHTHTHTTHTHARTHARTHTHNTHAQVAWLEGGQWQYPDIYMSSADDALRWPELEGMVLDRFIDHPKLPSEIRYLALPLQEVCVCVCVCVCVWCAR